MTDLFRLDGKVAVVTGGGRGIGVMMARGPEFDYVEKPSMELLAQLGWTPVDAFTETLGAQEVTTRAGLAGAQQLPSDAAIARESGKQAPRSAAAISA